MFDETHSMTDDVDDLERHSETFTGQSPEKIFGDIVSATEAFNQGVGSFEGVGSRSLILHRCTS